MKKLLILLPALLLTCVALAQVTPQYYIDYHPQGVGVPPTSDIALISDSGVIQSLCIADSFKNNPPYGRIKNVYLRTGEFSNGCKTYKLNVSLGYTALNNVDTATRLFSNLTLVAKADSLEMGTSLGEWIKIPLRNETDSFYFDPAQNMVVSMYMDSGVVMNYCDFLCSQFAPLPFYMLSSGKSNTMVPQKWEMFVDFGFDLYPTAIEEVSNLQNVRIFPNPANEKCTISFTVKKQISSYILSLTDITGKELRKETVDAFGNSVSKEIDVADLAKGIYFVEIRAGAERLTKKIVIE